MKKKALIVLAAFVGLVLLLALSLLAIPLRETAHANAVLADLTADYGFDRYRCDKPVSIPDPNAADLYWQAFAYQDAMYDATKDWVDVIYTSQKESREGRWEYDDVVTDSEVEVGNRLFAQYPDLLPNLQTAAAVPDCVFVTDWSQGLMTPLPHLGKLRASQYYVSLHMILVANRGEEAGVMSDLALAAAISRGPESDGCLISYLVQNALGAILIEAFQTALCEIELGSEDLVLAQDTIAALYGPRRYVDTVIGEAETIMPFIDRTISDGEVKYGMNNRLYLRVMKPTTRREVMDVTAISLSAEPEGPEEYATPAARMSLEPRIDAYLADLSLPERAVWQYIPLSGSLGKKDAQFATQVNVAVVGIAAERYRLAHGDWPASLADLYDLVPEANRHDWLDPDGGAIKIRKTERGFLAYSVGRDRADDGGVRRPRGNTKDPDDLVFEIRRPAQGNGE